MKIIVLAAVAAFAIPAQAEVYRWIDEQGQVHYSNAVPPDSACAAKANSSRLASPAARSLKRDTLPSAPPPNQRSPEGWISASTFHSSAG
jgi:hypothetical protein